MAPICTHDPGMVIMHPPFLYSRTSFPNACCSMELKRDIITWRASPPPAHSAALPMPYRLKSSLSLVLIAIMFYRISQFFRKRSVGKHVRHLSANDDMAVDVPPEQDVPQEQESAPSTQIGIVMGGSSSQEPLSESSGSSKSSRLFALLIGIDKYMKIRPLSGAVQDINDVERYLHEVLRTPHSQITTLKDEAASCEGIKDQLEHLAVDDRIHEGDAILVYFAGHGSTAVAPEEWKKFCQQVELIVPYDADTRAGTNMIADQELASYLKEIAKAKGDNITVVLDCCHSGSGTRTEDIETVRGVETTAPLSLNQSNWNTQIGNNSWPQPSTRSSSTFGSFAQYSETSHVFLAACGPNELAREKDGQGVFTSAFLKTLRSQRDINTCTYEDVLRQIGHLDNQSPQCEGMNKARSIFNNKMPNINRYLHQVTRNESAKYIIQAGTTHGISKGAKFSLYESREAFSTHGKSLGTMVASEEDVDDDFILIPDPLMRTPTDESDLLALQIFAGEDEYLRVYAAINDAIYPKLRFLEKQGNRPNRAWQIQLVDDEHQENACIGLSLEGDRMSVEILDKCCRGLGMERLTRTLKVDPHAENDHNLADFLEAVAFFMRHLKRERPCSQIKNSTSITFSTLARYRDPEQFSAKWKPKMIDGTVENLIFNDKIELDIPGDDTKPHDAARTTERYGLTIQNNSEWPLYASVFFFSASDFEITPYYEQPMTANNTANNSKLPCIPRGQDLAIGHGPSAWPAWQYGLGSDEDIDVGFIKIFLSTRPVQLSYLRQNSAFSSSRSSHQVLDPVEFSWCTISIPMVQRRKLPPPSS